MTNSVKILLFTVDLVFTEILKRILEKKITNYKLIVLNSFSDAKTFPVSNSIDLILVDDQIVGTSSYELISFLRLNMEFICPIIYFDSSGYDSEKKATMNGANHIINKPFNPEEVAKIIYESLQTSKIQNE